MGVDDVPSLSVSNPEVGNGGGSIRGEHLPPARLRPRRFLHTAFSDSSWVLRSIPNPSIARKKFHLSEVLRHIFRLANANFVARLPSDSEAGCLSCGSFSLSILFTSVGLLATGNKTSFRT